MILINILHPCYGTRKVKPGTDNNYTLLWELPSQWISKPVFNDKICNFPETYLHKIIICLLVCFSKGKVSWTFSLPLWSVLLKLVKRGTKPDTSWPETVANVQIFSSTCLICCFTNIYNNKTENKQIITFNLSASGWSHALKSRNAGLLHISYLCHTFKPSSL